MYAVVENPRNHMLCCFCRARLVDVSEHHLYSAVWNWMDSGEIALAKLVTVANLPSVVSPKISPSTVL